MNRNGAEKDEEDMEKLLTGLGYGVVKHRDLSGKQIKQCVKEFSENKDLSKTDSVFVVIMSHGREGKILGVEHRRDKPDIFCVSKIFRYLNSKNCPNLCNKPKVILIQACRGGEEGWASWQDNISKDDNMSKDNMEEDKIEHKEKDFVFFFPSTPGSVSYRHTKKGSPFIQNIVGVFNTHACKNHILELFIKVQQCLGNEVKSQELEMPCIDRNTLLKYFYLFPGL